MTDPMLHAARLPHEVRAAWTGDPGRPAPGQVWRARWDTSATLVLLLDVARTHVKAAPVTADVDLATSAAAVLPPEATTASTPLVVWNRLARALPTRVLDRKLADIAEAWSPGPGTDMGTLPGAVRGPAPMSKAEPGLEEEARLEDVLDVLAEAAWAPTGNGQLKQLLDANGVTLEQVRALPGVKPAEALTLRRGARPVAGPQVEALVELTGTPAEAWWSANPTLPASLVEELDQPAARAQVLALAARDQRSEIDERRSVAYDLFALAARQTGEVKTEDWAGRLTQYLAARGQVDTPW